MHICSFAARCSNANTQVSSMQISRELPVATSEESVVNRMNQCLLPCTYLYSLAQVSGVLCLELDKVMCKKPAGALHATKRLVSFQSNCGENTFNKKYFTKSGLLVVA